MKNLKKAIGKLCFSLPIVAVASLAFSLATTTIDVGNRDAYGVLNLDKLLISTYNEKGIRLFSSSTINTGITLLGNNSQVWTKMVCDDYGENCINVADLGNTDILIPGSNGKYCTYNCQGCEDSLSADNVYICSSSPLPTFANGNTILRSGCNVTLELNRTIDTETKRTITNNAEYSRRFVEHLMSRSIPTNEVFMYEKCAIYPESCNAIISEAFSGCNYNVQTTTTITQPYVCGQMMEPVYKAVEIYDDQYNNGVYLSLFGNILRPDSGQRSGEAITAFNLAIGNMSNTGLSVCSFIDGDSSKCISFVSNNLETYCLNNCNSVSSAPGACAMCKIEGYGLDNSCNTGNTTQTYLYQDYTPYTIDTNMLVDDITKFLTRFYSDTYPTSDSAREPARIYVEEGNGLCYRYGIEEGQSECTPTCGVTCYATGGSSELPVATTTVLGGVKLGSDDVQTEPAQSPTNTEDRTYAVQMDSSRRLVVNVPRVEKGGGGGYTLPVATTTVLGGVKLGSDTVQTQEAMEVSNTEKRTYAVQMNSSNQLVVNVPRVGGGDSGSYTLPVATTTVLGGVKLGSDTVQTKAAQSPSAVDDRTYPVQMDSSNRLVVNVPRELNKVEGGGDTHYVGTNIVGASNSATSNAASATNGNVWLNHVENGAVQSYNLIKGEGGTTVTAANGTITITSSSPSGGGAVAGGQNGYICSKDGSNVTCGIAKLGTMGNGANNLCKYDSSTNKINCNYSSPAGGGEWVTETRTLGSYSQTVLTTATEGIPLYFKGNKFISSTGFDFYTYDNIVTSAASHIRFDAKGIRVGDAANTLSTGAGLAVAGKIVVGPSATSNHITIYSTGQYNSPDRRMEIMSNRFMAVGVEGGAYMLFTGAQTSNRYNIGINTNTPKATLDINGTLRVGNSACAGTTCSQNTAGTIMYWNGKFIGCVKIGSQFKWREFTMGTTDINPDNYINQTCAPNYYESTTINIPYAGLSS